MTGLSSATSGQGMGIMATARSPQGIGLLVQNQAQSGNSVALQAQTLSTSGYAGFFLGGRNYFQGDVGVGTTLPQASVHAIGTIRAEVGAIASFAELTSLGFSTALRLRHGQLPSEWYMAIGGTGQLRLTQSEVATPALTVDLSNRIGIGTATPTNPLSIVGNADVSGTLSAGSLVGNGAGLTGLNAASIATGTLADARLSTNVATLAGTQTFSGTKTFSSASNSFTGSGAGLTALNASNISTGTLADARLSTNIPRLSATNNNFSGNITALGLVQSNTGFTFPDDTTQITAVAPIISAAVSVDPPSLGSLAGTTINVTVMGAAVGDAVVANPGANLNTGYVLSFARVSAANTVTLGFYNGTGATVNPSASTWQFRVMK